MSSYKNGQLPDWLLERRGNFLLTRGTWAKWDALVADVQHRFGVTLRITDGVDVMKGTGAYRDLDMQGAVKDYYTSIGRWWQAAAQGTSSHGGEFRGEDALAVDVTNYYLIPRAEFFAAARRADFEPNFFDGEDGKPDEPWHLIDRDPYRAVPTPAGDETEDQSKEDDDMATIISYNDPGDGVRNGIWGAQGGNLLKFTKEQWAQAQHRAPWADAPIVAFKPTGKKGDPTPRAFDLYKSTLTQGGPKTITTDQVQRIVTAALEDIGLNNAPVAVDYQALADAVNDDAAARMAG